MGKVSHSWHAPEIGVKLKSFGLRNKLMNNASFSSFYGASSSDFLSQRSGSHLDALQYIPAHPYSDIFGITQIYLLGIACVPILVQVLSFITWMTPSNPLILYDQDSPLA